MTIQTLRPNAQTVTGAFTPTGAATLWQATSDNSDASYANQSIVGNASMTLDLGTYTLLAGERVKLARTRQRYATSGAATNATNTLQDSSVGGFGGVWTSKVQTVANTSPATDTGGWVTPPGEVTQAQIDALHLITFAGFDSTAPALLRVYELYVDLDVRIRPVINTFTASAVGGAVTFNLTFTYGTSAIAETVTVRIEIFDDQGTLVDTVNQLVNGTDFAAQAVVIPYASSFGNFTARATVIAAGFPAPTTTYDSLPAEVFLSIPPAGVEPPILTCTTNQDAQTVSLEICQADNILPPSVRCLEMSVFDTGAFGNQLNFAGAGTVSTPDVAALDLTGDITVRMWVQTSDWTPTSERVLFGKMAAPLIAGYGATVTNTGLLTFRVGTGSARVMTSTAPGLVDGEGYWLEFFYNNTTKTCRFRKSENGLLTRVDLISWTTISTSAAHAGGSPTANTEALQLGSGVGTTLGWIGTIGYFDLIDGTPTVGTTVATAYPPLLTLGITSFTGLFGQTWTISGGPSVVLGTGVKGLPNQGCHGALWLNNKLVTVDMVFDATPAVVITGDTSGTVYTIEPARLVVAYDDGTPNTLLRAYPVAAPGPVVHGLNSTSLIVQARVTSTGLQAEVDVTIDNANQITIGGSFAESISVLILAGEQLDANCIPTIDETVLAATQGQVFPHNFASQLTLTTFVRTSDSRVSWVGVTLGVGEVIVDNDGAAGTMYISGFLAVFDNPDEVRAEVQRDGELIPLDGQNGAFVPPFGEGCLTVVDRFPERFAGPTCVGDPEPVGPTYRVRFYGFVDGVAASSMWSECTPPALIYDGTALLRSPTDPDLDISGCVTNEAWTRTRPQSIAQPVTGGIPAVRSGVPGGRDFALVITTRTTDEALAVEALLAGLYFWYSPLDPNLPAAWLAPTTQTGFTPMKAEGRPHDIGQSTTEVDPDPVLLPPTGPPA